MGAIRLQIFANTFAIGLTGGTATFAGSADLAAGTLNAAATTVRVIRSNVDTGVPARSLTRGTGEATVTIGTDFAIGAGVSTGTAVFAVSQSIDTKTATETCASGTDTFAGSTDLSSCTLCPTSLAVGAAAGGIDTNTATGFLT